MSRRANMEANLLVMGAPGVARELKTLAAWWKELFGDSIPNQYNCDTNLYSLEEAYDRLMAGNRSIFQ